jgi:hypothetical protein
MYRVPVADPSKTIVHRPGPRIVVYVSMVMLAVIVLPAYVLEPSRLLSGGAIVGLGVLVAFEVVLLAIVRRRVVLSVDPSNTTLTLEDLRWPLSGRVRQLPVAEVSAVTLQKAPRSLAVRVVLVLQSGAEMPLTRSYFGNGAHMARDLAAIRAFLQLG